MFNKLAKKLDLGEDIVKRIILCNHKLNNFYTKKQLKTLNLNLDTRSYKLIDRIAKVLKVDRGAVISVALEDYIKDTKS